MRKTTRKLDFDILEERTYDSEGKVIEIRKIYPPKTLAVPTFAARLMSGNGIQ